MISIQQHKSAPLGHLIELAAEGSVHPYVCECFLVCLLVVHPAIEDIRVEPLHQQGGMVVADRPKAHHDFLYACKLEGPLQAVHPLVCVHISQAGVAGGKYREAAVDEVHILYLHGSQNAVLLVFVGLYAVIHPEVVGSGEEQSAVEHGHPLLSVVGVFLEEPVGGDVEDDVVAAAVVLERPFRGLFPLVEADFAAVFPEEPGYGLHLVVRARQIYERVASEDSSCSCPFSSDSIRGQGICDAAP